MNGPSLEASATSKGKSPIIVLAGQLSTHDGHYARLLTDHPIEEREDRGSDLGLVRLERKVARVIEMDLGVGQVAAVRARAGRRKERIVRAPDADRERY